MRDDEIKELKEVIKNNNEDNYYNALCIYKQDNEISDLKNIIKLYSNACCSSDNIIKDKENIQDLQIDIKSISKIINIKDKKINDLRKNIKNKNEEIYHLKKNIKNNNNELYELKTNHLINLDYINDLSYTNSTYFNELNNMQDIITRKTNLISILNEDIINKNKEIIELKFQIKIITDISSLSCSICLEDINTDDDKYITKCNHLFHTSCLNKWGKNNTCPNCRIKL